MVVTVPTLPMTERVFPVLVVVAVLVLGKPISETSQWDIMTGDGLLGVLQIEGVEEKNMFVNTHVTSVRVLCGEICEYL